MGKNRRLYLLAGAVLFSAAVFSGCGSSTKLNVMDYVQVTFSGMNGEGRVVVNFDEEAALSAIAAESKEGLSENEKISIRNILSIAERDIAVSTESGLKNGDSVKVTTKLDGGTLKEYKTGIHNDTKEFEVTGLVDAVTISLADYVTFTYNGFNGAGTAYAGFDWDGYAQAVNTQIQAVSGTGTGADSNVIAQVRNAPYVSAPEQSGLSNGDTVTASVSANPAQYDSVGIVLEGGEVTQTVSGLEEPQEVDLAEAVTPVYYGICPNLEVKYEVNWDLPYADGITRPESQEAVLNNGDILEGEIAYDEYYFQRNGFLVSDSGYSYEVSGLPTYLVDYTQEKAQETVKAWAEEKMAAGAFSGSVNIAETYLEDYTQADWQEADIQLAGIYGGTADISSSGKVFNKLYLLSLTSVPVDQGDGTSQTQNIWTVNSIGKLVQKPDGSLYDPAEVIKDQYDNQMEKTEYDDNGEIINYRVWGSESFGTRDEAMSAIEADMSDVLGSDAVSTVILENEVQEAEGSSGTAHELPQIQAAQAAEVDQALASQAVAGPVVLNGHTYLAFAEVNGKLLNWNEADKFCTENGGHLVTVTGIQEQALLNYLEETADTSIYYWIGLSDKETEGVFAWVTGEETDFTYWADGQPDNDTGSDKNGEDAAEAFWGSYGRWNDRQVNSDGNGFMMEIEPVSEATVESECLTDLVPSYKRESDIQWYRTDTFGNLHIYPMGMDARDYGRVDYILSGEYSLLNFNLSVDQETSSDAVANLRVWGDGKLLYSAADFSRTTAPQDVSIDVTGIDRISIQTRSDNGYALVLLSEGLLVPAGQQEQTAAVRSLEDLTCMASDNMDTTYPMSKDLNGRCWREMYRLYDRGQMSYNLGKKYTTFQAVIAPADDNTYDSADIRIYGDGELLAERNEYTYLDGAVLVRADVSDVRVLTIEAVPSKENGRNQEVRICDTLLTGELSAETAAEEAALSEEYVYPELDEKYAAMCAGFINCGPVRYYRFDIPVNRVMASTYAEEMGAALAVPESDAQRYAIAKLLEGNGNNWYHLGLFYTQGLGGWVRPDSTKVLPTDWLFEQLPDWNTTDYPFLVERYSGDFELTNATDTFGFVVQVRAVSGPALQTYSSLTDLEWVTKGDVYDTGYVLDNTYFRHSLALEFYDYSSVSVDLNGAYSTFSGNLSYGWMSPGQTASFAVFGDGRLLWEMDNVRIQDLEELVPFQVDVSGVKTLSIEAKRILVDDNMQLLVIDPKLVAADTASVSGVSRLHNMETVDRSNTDIYPNELFRDKNGALHEGAIRMNSGEAYLYYNLNKQYTSLSLTLTAGANTNGNDQLLSVLLDDQLVWEETFNATSENVTKVLDVTGATVLQIRKTAAEDSGSSTLYLEDDFLQ